MSRYARWLAVPVLLAVGAAGAVAVMKFRGAPADVGEPGPIAEGGEAGAPGEAPPATATVRVEPARREALERIFEGYGAVAPRPGAMLTVSWPVELQVVQVMVVPGQAVAGGNGLCRVRPSPEASLQFDLAGQSAAATAVALETARARLGMSLGTRPEVEAAQAAADEASRRLQALRASAPPEDGIIRATAPGLVHDVPIQAGGIAPAGSPLVVVVAPGAVVAKIGFEPAAMGELSPGAAVTLESPGQALGPWEARVTLVAPALNPSSRLVEVTAEFTGDDRPLEGLSLRATVRGRPVEGVTVPREAVLPTPDGDVIFVVADGKAQRRIITVGHRTRERVQVPAGLEPGESVVVLGQAELEDGAPVAVGTGP